jgi:hypothetical protein
LNPGCGEFVSNVKFLSSTRLKDFSWFSKFQHLQTLAGGMQMLESNHEAAIPGFANEWLLSFPCRAGFLTQNRRPLLGKPA